MSERTGSKGTFYSLAKWFRWASLIIILAPLVSLVFGIVDIISKTTPQWVVDGNNVLSWIVFVAGIIWFILIIVLFCTAGRVKDQINALGTRIALIIALALVLAPAIVAMLTATDIIKDMQDITKVIIVIVLPIVQMIGYIVAASTAGRAKRKLS